MFSLNQRTNLLRGKPISIFGKFKIHQYTLQQIHESIGFEEYYAIISLLCIDKMNIKIMLNTLDDITPYHFFINGSLYDATGEFYKNICNGLGLFLKEQVWIDSEKLKFATKDGIIGDLDFEDIVSAIREINFVPTEEIIQIKNEKHLEYLIESRKRKQKYCKPSSSDVVDIISAFCSKHPSINLYNVWDLTIYQLMNQLHRLNLIDNYWIAVKSLLAGANKNEVNVVHWSERFSGKS